MKIFVLVVVLYSGGLYSANFGTNEGCQKVKSAFEQMAKNNSQTISATCVQIK